MWLKLISDLSKDYKTHLPLSDEWIVKGLSDLDVTLNDSLKLLLLETDGLYDFGQFLWIVWNVRDLSAYNLAMRNDQKFADMGYSFTDIFFFSNAGVDGILFGFPIVDDTLNSHIVSWHPKTDERTQIADDLADYLKNWMNKLP